MYVEHKFEAMVRRQQMMLSASQLWYRSFDSSTLSLFWEILPDAQALSPIFLCAQFTTGNPALIATFVLYAYIIYK